jgi:hypothetical protein
MIVEERVRPTESAQPPAEKRWYAEGDEAEPAWRRCVRRERPDGGALEDLAKGRAEHVISGTVSIVAHERMNDADNREAWAGSVADRGPATISVPAEDLAGEVQAAHSVRAGGKLHTARWHVEDVCSTRFIEHVWPLEEARERLTVLAVADETEAGVRRNFVRDAAHVAASAAKQEILRALSHKTQLIDPMRWVRFRTREHSNSMASVIYEV